MKNMKKVLTAAAALALSLSLLAGCGPDGSASGSASVSGSASASSGVEQAPPAPGEADSKGMGRQFADLVSLYIKKCGLGDLSIPDAQVKSGSDQEIGPHLKQTYALSAPLTLVVYTDPEDGHLLRVSFQLADGANEHDLKLAECAMVFVPTFFDPSDVDAIQEHLHLKDPVTDQRYAAESASGIYQFMKSAEGTSFEYFAK